MIFPCEFVLKIMGKVDAKLELAIVPTLERNIADMTKVEITSRMSKGGKFTAVTVTFMADSQEQLDNIYRELTARPDVLMVL